MSDRLTAVSLFSGCGGFDLGATQAGLRVIWANDHDPAASASYRELLPRTTFVEGDVRDVKEFPIADVLIGCYPCTGFSVGARRRWHDRKVQRDLHANHDNYLYRQFVRALRQVLPQYFFVENVRGLVSADSGWFLKRQIANFSKLGYRVSVRLLNANDYGVPQTRRRLFLVGVRRAEQSLKYAFPKPRPGNMQTLRDVIWDMKRWPEGEYFDYKFHGHYLTRNRKRGWDEPSFTIVADMHHAPLHPMGLSMEYVETDTWRLRGKSNRRLSWRECARIQGLPDEPFEAVRSHKDKLGRQSLALRYEVVGNAVPPALARALVRPVVLFERGRAR